MNKISEKRRALYLRCLGRIPNRPLTREERIKCGLKVSEIDRSAQRTDSLKLSHIAEATNAADLTVKGEPQRLPALPKPKDTPAERACHDSNTHNSLSRKQRQRTISIGRDITPDSRGRIARRIRRNSYKPNRVLRNSRARNVPNENQFLDSRSYITKDGRLRLRGEDYEALRRQAFERASGLCERIWEECQFAEKRCLAWAPLDGSIFTRGHLAHLKHGPRKSDTLDQVIWSCAACHFAEHGLRWRKQRMAKAWHPDHFLRYYVQGKCICGGEKPLDSAMCNGCRDHLRIGQPALLHVIENGTGDPVLQAMGEFSELVRSAK